MGVIIVDKGWNGIKSRFGALHNVYTKVGYPMESPKTRETKKKSPLTVGEVAAILEDGTRDGRIPPRPTLKPAFDDNIEDNSKLCATIGKGILNGTLTTKQGLSIIGERNRDLIVRKINGLLVPALAKRTIAARRAAGNYSTKPLVHTAQMKGAVSHVEVIQ